MHNHDPLKHYIFISFQSPFFMERVCVTYRIDENEIEIFRRYLDLYRYSCNFIYRKGIYKKGVPRNQISKFSGPKEGMFTLTVFDSDLEKVIDEFMGRDSNPSDLPRSSNSSA